MIRKILNWIYKTAGRYYFTEGKELPDKFTGNEVFIADSLKNNWVVAMKCPCGCGDTIYLNTLKSENPSWEVKYSIKGISIYPSVWRTKKCKSHFWLRKGKIKWATRYNSNLIS